MFFGCDSCGPIAQFALDVFQEIPDCSFQIVRCKRTASKEPCHLRLLQGFQLFLVFGVERLAQVHVWHDFGVGGIGFQTANTPTDRNLIGAVWTQAQEQRVICCNRHHEAGEDVEQHGIALFVLCQIIVERPRDTQSPQLYQLNCKPTDRSARPQADRFWNKST